ncbi:AMP-binding protein [Actinomadura scrupuli]|uniref:AMP-binding protein n=1 Tax=Actinomadura scrupuli TaxID=559629 RepID=UPI003D99E5DF
MRRSGLLWPGSPARMVHQLVALQRWGTTLAGSFIVAAIRDPDRPAIVDEFGALSYAEVDDRTTRLAIALGAGFDTEDGPPRVALLCRNHRGMVESLIACGKLGADTVLLNTGLATEQLLTILAEQRIDVLIADAEFEPLLVAAPGSIRKLTADGLDDLLAATPQQPFQPFQPPERPGRTIVLSSGTTGSPKGAERPPRPGLRPFAAVASRIPLRAGDTMLIEAPLFHTWGYAGLQLALALRATVVLNRRYEAQSTLAAIERHRCTVLIAVPVMLQRLLELPVDQYDLRTLRVVAASGSALPGGLATGFMEAFGDVLYNLYGSTEASWVSIATPEDLRERPGTAGRPPRGTRLAILDADGAPVPPGAQGHIHADNEMLFDGYTSGEPREGRDGMLSLGDIGHLDPQGRLFVEGRGDDMVISGGENIFPGEVEDVIARLPEVREVAVLGVPDARFGQRLAAYVVVRAGEHLDCDAVRDCVRQRFARFAVPRDVHFLDSLPRTPAGKIVRSTLLDLKAAACTS